MAIKKNLLWDPSDLNNPQTLFNTKKYYANQDFIYGSDLNLILAPLTHALQFYPLYNDNNTRSVYNTDTSLLIPYNASGQAFEQKPTLFRLSYQGNYNGDVNVVFDNSKSGYNANVLIDGNYYGKEVRVDNVYFKSDNISNLSLARFYSDIHGPATSDYSNLKLYVSNNAIFEGVNTGYDNSYTEVMNRLIMTHLRYNEVGDDEYETTATHFTLDASGQTGTLYLKSGIIATQSDLNALKPTSSGWRVMNFPNDDRNPYPFNNTKADVKGVYLIEVRDDDQTGRLEDVYAHASVIVSIDTYNDPRWNRTSFGDDSVAIGIGSFTNTIQKVVTQNDPTLVKSINYTYSGYDAVAYFKYDDSAGGMGYYLEFNGANRSGNTEVVKFNEYKVTKLFDL
jgi:hypothetical protein